MRKNIVAFVMLCSSMVALGMSAPVRAEVSQNTIGPSLAIGSGTTSIGIDSRFVVSENLSVRPFVFFPSGGTVFGSSLTYDFASSRASKFDMTPYLGGGVAVGAANNGGTSTTQVFFTGGADFGITDSIDLKAALDVPLTSNNSSTNVRLGAGFKF
jgi:opacity protein-like surface antigen